MNECINNWNDNESEYKSIFDETMKFVKEMKDKEDKLWNEIIVKMK